jgi:hypothetical protein
MRVSTETTQVCYICHRTSDEVPFYANARRFNGYDSACISCKKSIKRSYRGSTQPHRDSQKRYYASHCEEINKARRERYAIDPEYREAAKRRVQRSRLIAKYGLIVSPNQRHGD